jgi:hypothetical protein
MKYTIFTLLLLTLMQPGGAQENKLNGKGMPILAWYSIPPEQTTVARYLEMKDAGITHSLSFFNDAESMARALDTAYAAGIRLIVYCPELKTAPEKTVKRFMKHPAVAGYMLRDEPNRADFPELAAWYKKIHKADPDHFCYLNLFPNYADEKQLGTKTYQEHVDLFVKEVPVEFISFDHYPVLGDSLRANWYENLEIIADAAKKAGKPFWAFSLSVAHGKYPVPTLPQLRLQMFSDLAYGAQGLEYFTYWTPYDTTWNFNTAPIGLNGKRTVVYDRVRQVNNELKTIAGIFNGAVILSVSHTGQIPQGTRPLEKLPPEIKVLKTIKGGAVVSHFVKGDEEFLSIVNRDFKAPLSLSIECEKGVYLIKKDGSRSEAGAYCPETEIDPGDIAIYVWKKHN